MRRQGKRLVADLSLDKRMLQEVLAKSLKPSRKRPIVNWLKASFAVSNIRACRLMLLGASSYWYHSVVKDHRAVLLRLKELAYTRVCYGYRRLTVLLQREGWPWARSSFIGCIARKTSMCAPSRGKSGRRKIRVPLAAATAANQRWSMDFMSERFENGIYFRLLTVIDQFTREYPLLWADVSMTGLKLVGCHIRSPWTTGRSFAAEPSKPRLISAE